MAKMNKYDREHLRRLSLYQARIDAIFDTHAREAAAIGQTIGTLPEGALFSFDDYPLTRDRVNRLLSGLRNDVLTCIVNGIDSEWTLANNKNNELARMVFGSAVGRLPQAAYRRYFSTNDAAREAFKARQVAGLSLSDRVWNYTTQFKSEIEFGLDIGIRSGQSAAEMTKELRNYLRHPDKLFRRVRDEHGILQLSKAAAAFHPGQGVYRSSYKNARRLAATETNIAYRTSDHERWQQMDFVVGIEIQLSNNHTCLGADGKPHEFYDICDELKGRYPKDFKFTGWHPHCRCHAVSILKTEKEIAEDTQRILDGEPVTGDSVNRVDDVPQAFNDWVAENRERIERAQSLPYFLRDNEGYMQQAIRLSEAVLPRSVERLGTLSDVQEVYNFVKLRDPANAEEQFNNGICANFDFLGVREELNAACQQRGITLNNWRAIIHGEDVFSIVAEDAEFKQFYISRTFFGLKDGVEVHHSLFEIGKKYQGGGISKEVFRIFYKQYQRIGVRYINVEANIDVGGYTWARYGFMAVDKDAALNAWAGVHCDPLLVKRAEEFIEEWYKKNALPPSEPFPMRLLTEGEWQGLGKQLLCGTDWEGKIDLRDPTQRRIFEEYLFS